MKKLLLLFCLFLANKSFAQTNYYVSNSGNNSNNGSLAAPFKTITYASTIANHGDTINVMAGTYTNATYGTWNIWKKEQTVRISNKNSTSGKYLVIRPNNNAVVKLKCDGNFIFQIRNSSYIKVQGFEIEGETNNIPLDSAFKYQFVYHDEILNKDTFRVAFGTPKNVVEGMTFPLLNNITKPSVYNSEGLTVQNSHHIDITKNKIYSVPSAGLRIAESDYIRIIENEISNCTRRTSVGPPAFVLSLINSIDANDETKIFIQRNKVYNNFNEVYSWAPTKTIITPKIDEGKGISLEHCVTRTAPDPSWHHGRVRIENNICYGNGLSGINTNEAERVDIINNTVYQNIASQTGANTGISVNETDDALVANNIVVSINSFGGYALASRLSTNLVVKNNLVQGTIDSDIDAIDAGTIFANPNFVDAITFKLQSSSQAINKAFVSLAPKIDYYNQNRDATPDIGAVEYGAPLSTTSFLSRNSNIVLYPNPANNTLFIDNVKSSAYKIYSIDGKMMLSSNFIEENPYLKIDISSLSTGVYMIFMDNNYFKFIKN